jgi:molybdopterin-guanine dinucleotide biosynthesis protein A
LSAIGIVMCGGRSLRMGKDKGMLPSGTKTWAEKAFATLGAAPVPVYISVNGCQVSQYAQIFTKELLITDTVDIPGPMAGLLSAHVRFPEKDLLIIACDLPDMSRELVISLWKYYVENTDRYENYVFGADEIPEPMCGIYAANILKRYYTAFLAGSISNFSLKSLLSSGNTLIIPLRGAFVSAFKNYNQPSDLSDKK